MQRDASWFGHGGTAPCILGMSFARRFTVDLDGHARRLRLFPAGTGIDSILDSAAARRRFDPGVVRQRRHRDAMRLIGTRTEARIDTGWGFVTPNARCSTGSVIETTMRAISAKTCSNPIPAAS